MGLKMLILLSVAAAASASQVLPGCQEMCGNISIPYPFGMKDGCYSAESEWFRVLCNDSLNPPKPFLGTGNLEIIEISLSQEQVFVKNFLAKRCYSELGKPINSFDAWIKLDGTPYTFSDTRNRFTAVGCDTVAIIQGIEGRQYTGGFISICTSKASVTENDCSGVGCCQTTIPKGLKAFKVSISSLRNYTGTQGLSRCSHAFLVDHERYKFTPSDLSDPTFVNGTTELPVVLDWAIGNKTCKEASKSTSTYACGENSFCSNSRNGPGYTCSCKAGYQGNPYLNHCCQDIDECASSSTNDCKGICMNTAGSYTCSCPKDSYGDGRGPIGCIRKAKRVPVLMVVLGAGFGFIFLLVGIYLSYLGLKKRRLIKLKEHFFKQNGGLLLQQQLSSYDGASETTKIFTLEELKAATNNFDERLILGRGGNGTVYKGTLSNNRTVAIKKSRHMDETQIEQFVNELAILSHINHRNVVKLLGGCLETQVPLLVYEYVPNGTLTQHIHNETHELSWHSRLEIATETAGALAYLHSAASTPIFHRDIKCSNILLDEKYRAKVSDFGASRLVPVDRFQITTLVQGTLGYLDPEYFQTGQLTAKSDVYSFGVVLVELLTGQMPLSFKRAEEDRNLSMYFISSMRRNQLFEILEPRVAAEGVKKHLVAVALLAERCLNLKGDERPTMKEVAAELEGLRSGGGHHPWVDQRNHGETASLFSEPSQFHTIAMDSTGFYNVQSQQLLPLTMPR